VTDEYANSLAGPLELAIGATLARRRRELGLTTVEVARKLDAAPARIVDYESGKLRVPSSDLAKLARLLDLRIEQLFAPLVAALESAAATTDPSQQPPQVSGEVIDLTRLLKAWDKAKGRSRSE
jgi:transcriptional regulator with XRE-family HTH domain